MKEPTDSNKIYKSKHDFDSESRGTTNQDRAFLFVGKFVSDFANIEKMMGMAIISYFTVDPTLNTERKQEIYSKNFSINSIMEFSVLGNPYLSFQMKSEIIKPIIQTRSPETFIKYGDLLMNLINLFQKLRNIIAHSKTYVYEEKIFISKPKPNWNVTKYGTQKGGIVPEPTGKYETSYEQSIITKEIEKTLFSQMSCVHSVLAYYSIGQNSDLFFEKLDTKKMIAETLELEIMSKFGIYDIGILK